MLEKIIIFILFLGPLVFFHELGHFFFARLFGVRVEVFSIGFGPKIFKFKKGATEYALSLIPLGGYVKMFGDDPFAKDEIPEEDRKNSFNHKSKWARFCIVFGGPLANFILAYFIFFTLFMVGEKTPEMKVGVIPQESALYQKGLRTSDVLRKVNGNEIYNPSDIILDGKDIISTLTVSRKGQFSTINIGLKGQDLFKELMKYPPILRKPIFINSKQERFVLGINPKKIVLDISLDEMIESGTGESLYLIPVNKDLKIKNTSKALSQVKNIGRKLLLQLSSMGYYSLDLVVKSVKMNSPADKSGVKANDVLSGINGTKVTHFESFKSLLQKTSTKSVMIQVYRGDKEIDLKIEPELKEIQDKTLKLIGVYSAGEFQRLRFVETGSRGFVGSFTKSFSRTWETFQKTLGSFKKLLTGEVSVKNIGGPLAIGKVASDSFNTSLSYFFQLMALISVHLAVINLFPIPVLDGGHIVFLALETINRGPISRRKMEIAQQVGLSMLLILMFGALFNDAARFLF